MCICRFKISFGEYPEHESKLNDQNWIKDKIKANFQKQLLLIFIKLYHTSFLNMFLAQIFNFWVEKDFNTDV